MQRLILLIFALLGGCQCSPGTVTPAEPQSDAGSEGGTLAEGCLYDGWVANFEGHSTLFCVAHSQLRLNLDFRVGPEIEIELNDGEERVGRTRVVVTDFPARVNVVPCRNEQYDGPSPYPLCDDDASMMFLDSFGQLIAQALPLNPQSSREQYLRNMRGQDDINTAAPEEIQRDISGAELVQLDALDAVDRVDRARFSMRNGIFSEVLLIHPGDPKDHLVVYHQGHRGSPLLGIDIIEALLNEGFTVLAMAMPLRGPNEVPELGRFHYRIFDLESDDWRAMDYFISPVTRAITWGLLEAELEGDVFMTGISGGGWTTFHAAAIDTRIKKSAPVAGGVPLFSRRLPLDDWGDEEQTNLSAYSAFNYLELFALGALNDRSTLFIQNENDTCCFSGHDAKLWEHDLQDILGDDGAFTVFVDDTHASRAISPEASARILEFFNEP